LRRCRENRLKPSAIYATHCHFDHVMAVEDLKQAFNIPFYIHRADEEILMLNKEMDAAASRHRDT
jgi:hydroxyacylglutathione hydrolase